MDTGEPIPNCDRVARSGGASVRRARVAPRPWSDCTSHMPKYLWAFPAAAIIGWPQTRERGRRPRERLPSHRATISACCLRDFCLAKLLLLAPRPPMTLPAPLRWGVCGAGSMVDAGAASRAPSLVVRHGGLPQKETTRFLHVLRMAKITSPACWRSQTSDGPTQHKSGLLSTLGCSTHDWRRSSSPPTWLLVDQPVLDWSPGPNNDASALCPFLDVASGTICSSASRICAMDASLLFSAARKNRSPCHAAASSRALAASAELHSLLTVAIKMFAAST